MEDKSMIGFYHQKHGQLFQQAANIYYLSHNLKDKLPAHDCKGVAMCRLILPVPYEVN
jgi:hypothetical protein